MRFLSPLLFLVLFGALTVTAQTEYPMGLVLDDADYDQLPHTSSRVDLGQKSISAQIDLSAYCPEIRHQGEASSCVGWSLGYAAMTIERAVKNNWTDKQQISENANSALFLFSQISQGNCQRAISMSSALRLLEERGNCLARDFDFDPNNCAQKISEEVLQKAADYKIEDYQALFKSEAVAEKKIQNVKILLAQKKPVIVGMQVLQNFYQIRSGDQSWWPSIGNTQYAGAHAMTVVGYDDNKFSKVNRDIPANMQGAFKVMNSWGKNWGENGFIWIRYAHFGKFCRQAFAISLSDGSPIDLSYQGAEEEVTPNESQARPAALKEIASSKDLVRLSGSFEFRHYQGWDQGFVFEGVPVHFIQDHYNLVGDWKVNDKFQLLVKSGFNQGYIYVLSVDAIGKAEVHFPKSKKYNISIEGNEESPLLLSSGATLCIPSTESVLQLSRPGTDHLVVLFSTKKIKPKYVKALCKTLSAHKSDLLSELHRILGKHMVPPADIHYSPDQMSFEVSSRSGGKIVPLVLEVEVGEN